MESMVTATAATGAAAAAAAAVAAAPTSSAFHWSLPPAMANISPSFSMRPAKLARFGDVLPSPSEGKDKSACVSSSETRFCDEEGDFPLASHPTIVLHVLTATGLAAEDLARLEAVCTFFRKPAQFEPHANLPLVELAAMDRCNQLLQDLPNEEREDLRSRCGGTWKLLLRFLLAGEKCYRRALIQVVAGSGHSVAVSDSGAAYTFGTGESGELGRGAVESDWRPGLVSSLQGHRIVQVSAGHGRTLFVTDRGQVYACGRNSFGDPYEFSGPPPKIITSPRPLEGLEDIFVVQAAIGHFFTAVLARDGRVYTFAWGEDGRLGHSSDGDNTAPSLIKSLEGHPVVQIAAGNCYMLALTHNRDGGSSVFSVGCGLGGKLGLGNKGNERFPRAISKFRELNFRPRMVAAGLFHAAAVSEDGRVATWGWGHHGCLGHGSTDCESSPRVVEALVGQKAIHVTAGDYTTFVLLENGDVFSFGAGESSSLGHGPDPPSSSADADEAADVAASSPFADDDDDNDDDVDAGNNDDDDSDDDGDANGGDAVALNNQANGPGLGNHAHVAVANQAVPGAAGPVVVHVHRIAAERLAATPRDVHLARRVDVLSDLPQGDRVVQISASNFPRWSSHTLALTEKGRVFSFGAGGRGQLGVEMTPPPGALAGPSSERSFSRCLPEAVEGLCLTGTAASQ